MELGRAVWGGLVAMALLSGGCAARHAPVGTAVRSISFEGNGPWLSSRSDAALRQAMGHPKPKGIWPLRKKVALDESLLDSDEKRLYVHYAHLGYFDEQLVRWRIDEVRPGTDERAPVVKVVGVIDQGDPSPIREIGWDGLDPVSGPLAQAIRNEASVAKGDTFTLAAHQATLQRAAQLLHEHAYAHAKVDGEVEVTADGVRLHYHVDPGVVARFGPVTFDGGEDVPRKFVEQKLEVADGEAYRASELQQTQQKLYGLGAFAVVEVKPQLDAQPPDVVPVQISLQERAPRSIGLGAGLQAQSGRQELLGRVQFGHVNALHRLVSVDLEAEGGYAALADGFPIGNPFTDVRGGPIVDSALTVGIPGVPFPKWRHEVELGFERQVTEAYQLNRPSITPSISGPLAKNWLLTLSYWLEYTQYLDIQVDPQQLAALDGSPDLVNGSYIGAHLEQTLIWDTRDDPLMPTRGHRHRVTLTEAGNWLGGTYDYLGVDGELRGYWSLPRRWGGWSDGFVLAGRIGGGILAPYGPPERRAVPVADRLYLGGSGSVRGWIYQHLGPYVCVVNGIPCSSATGATTQADTVPVGGRVQSFGTAEVRKDWANFGLVSFVDAGMVWATVDDVPKVPILPSVGLGGRVLTPVGPFRLDVAVRTDNLPMFEQEPRVWFHLGLGEAF
ncbi:MAG: BamA/TamA family outer membrane protein [Myxococcota bacterium]